MDAAVACSLLLLRMSHFLQTTTTKAIETAATASLLSLLLLPLPLLLLSESA